MKRSVDTLSRPFDFRDLFVLDMANNHHGSLPHGLDIIAACARVVADNQVRAALKFQFRQLDTLIHPSHRVHSDNKHVSRFLSTALTRQDFRVMADAVKTAGMVTMATPFDESSVDVIEELDIEVIKIASCSATDWPLLEKIAVQNRPVIVSTGGLSLDSIADIVSFFDHRRVYFALMHCVAIYPTPAEHLQLNQVQTLRRRHPHVVVGFSTHECPTDTGPVTVAVAKGAEILERHVGVETETIKLNNYSSTPEHLDLWLKAALRAKTMCGAVERPPAEEAELTSLASLARGIYARTPLGPGDRISADEVYFAMPVPPGGLSSGQWKDGMTAKAAIEADAPLLRAAVELPSPHPKAVLLQAIHHIKSQLNEAHIALPIDFQLEFSHHYGIERFREVGAVLIDCVNRGYCKKIIVQLAGQRHPNHFHQRKEETFQVLDGLLIVEIEGRQRTLYPGDTLVVPQGVWHSFRTDTGVIFEEISGTHHNDDSFYEDKRINSVARHERKTLVSQWGRYQL